jgi:hypothetical protein
MNTIKRSFISAFVILLCISCGKTTEYYAQKEHKMKFGIWELNYAADDYYIYWPSVRLSEPISGEMTAINNTYDWWTGHRFKPDTTNNDAIFKAYIQSVKSKSDAQYYNSIKFEVIYNNKYYYNYKHNFIFTNEDRDTLSFSAKPNDDGYFVPNREKSEEIIEFLCKDKPISLTVKFNGTNTTINTTETEGSYYFEMSGSPKLSNAMEINHKRKVLAYKEYQERRK